nr:MAG TPA: hypothetical protein [Caudoviricetes sp.]
MLLRHVAADLQKSCLRINADALVGGKGIIPYHQLCAYHLYVMRRKPFMLCPVLLRLLSCVFQKYHPITALKRNIVIFHVLCGIESILACTAAFLQQLFGRYNKIPLADFFHTADVGNIQSCAVAAVIFAVFLLRQYQPDQLAFQTLLVIFKYKAGVAFLHRRQKALKHGLCLLLVGTVKRAAPEGFRLVERIPVSLVLPFRDVILQLQIFLLRYVHRYRNLADISARSQSRQLHRVGYAVPVDIFHFLSSLKILQCIQYLLNVILNLKCFKCPHSVFCCAIFGLCFKNISALIGALGKQHNIKQGFQHKLFHLPAVCADPRKRITEIITHRFAVHHENNRQILPQSARRFDQIPDKLRQVNPFAVSVFLHALHFFVRHAGVQRINYYRLDMRTACVDTQKIFLNFRDVPCHAVIIVFFVILRLPPLPGQSLPVTVDIIGRRRV